MSRNTYQIPTVDISHDEEEAHLLQSGPSSPRPSFQTRKPSGSRRSSSTLLNVQRNGLGLNFNDADTELADIHVQNHSDRTSTSTIQTDTENPLSKAPPHDRTRQFRARRQLLRLLGVGLFRLLITLILAGAMYGTVYHFQSKEIMQKYSDKVYFNTLTTALSMALGISIASGMKQVAVDIKWWILSRKSRSLEKVDQFLDIDSQTTVFFMGIKYMWNLKIGHMWGPLSWLLLLIVAQAAVAVLQLTYGLDTWSVPTSPQVGLVNVTSLADFSGGADSPNARGNELAAHTLGMMVTGTSTYFANTTTNLTDTIQILNNTIYNNTQGDYFKTLDDTTYIFQQWYEDDTTNQLTQYYSDRYITANSSCTVYSVTNPQVANGGGNVEAENGPTVGFDILRANSTTFLALEWSGTEPPRAAHVCAFENLNAQVGWYYECEISLSNVANAYNAVHNFSEDQAKVAAQSIALQGSSTQAENFELYPNDYTTGEWLNGDINAMAERVRDFAIASIVGLDSVGEFAVVPGLQGPRPTWITGLRLKVEYEGRFLGILLAIVIGQAALSIGGSLIANRVYVPDNSKLKVAQYLRYTLDGYEGGSLMSSDEICEDLESRSLRYGSKVVENGRVRLLGIGEGFERKFPEGIYH